MSNRSPGEGTLVQRKDGRWQASLMLDGKRRTVYGSTRKEAAQKLSQLKEQARGGALPDPGKRTISDLLDSYLEAVRPNLKAGTWEHYRLIADTYIRPALGSLRLSKLAPDRVQRLYRPLQEQGHNRTAQLVHFVLGQACGLAVQWRWLPENPCERVLRPQYRARRRDVWRPDDLASFLAGTDGHWLQPLWLLLLSTGCRLGEALALAWDDVQDGAVSVTKTGQYVRGQWTVTEPKTRAGTRTITVPPEASAALRRQRAQQSEWRLRAGKDWERSELVFTGETGRPLHRATVAHALRRNCETLGLPAVTPHGHRHLHASVLLSQGLPVPLVSQRLGHAHPGITMSVYAHAVKQGDDEAAQAIGRTLRASS